MNMQSIGSTINPIVPQAGDHSARVQDRREAFKQMSQSMQSGDLSTARTAYASLVRNAPPSATMQPGSPFAQLGKALASGDMSGAQSAWGTMVQDHQDKTNPISVASPVVASSTTGGVAGTSLNVTA